jgi:hypothetical protein
MKGIPLHKKIIMGLVIYTVVGGAIGMIVKMVTIKPIPMESPEDLPNSLYE